MTDTATTPVTGETQVKHFTETQVEQIVKERLARDREARKDESAEKIAQIEAARVAAEAKLTETQTQLKALEGTSATAAEIEKKVEGAWENIEKAIPEELKKLVPAKLSTADKIEYIAQNRSVFFPDAGVQKPNTPAAPVVNGKLAGDEKFGGFTSEVEFAQRDPKGYLAHKAKGGRS